MADSHGRASSSQRHEYCPSASTAPAPSSNTAHVAPYGEGWHGFSPWNAPAERAAVAGAAAKRAVARAKVKADAEAKAAANNGDSVQQPPSIPPLLVQPPPGTPPQTPGQQHGFPPTIVLPVQPPPVIPMQARSGRSARPHLPVVLPSGQQQPGLLASPSFRSALYAQSDSEGIMDDSPSFETTAGQPAVRKKVLGVHTDSDLIDPVRFLSDAAINVRLEVDLRHNVKNGATWIGTFTGKDLVTAIRLTLPEYTRVNNSDRRLALAMARSMHAQGWVADVEGETDPIRDPIRDPLRDSHEEVLKFVPLPWDYRQLVPEGVNTMGTKCYSSTCTGDGKGCYSPCCPYKTSADTFFTAPTVWGTSVPIDADTSIEADTSSEEDHSVPRHRSVIIDQAKEANKMYLGYLDAIETVFKQPLLAQDPPVIEPKSSLELFVGKVFGNIADVRRHSEDVIDTFIRRLRANSGLLEIEEEFFERFSRFQGILLEYTGNHFGADELLKQTFKENRPFREWLGAASYSGTTHWDLYYLLQLPLKRLEIYHGVVESIFMAIDDAEVKVKDSHFLRRTLRKIRHASELSEIKLWHSTGGERDMITRLGPKGKPIAGKEFKWHHLVPDKLRKLMGEADVDNQCHIWDLILMEMQFVYDKEVMETVFISSSRGEEWERLIKGIFRCCRPILKLHKQLLDDLKERQIKQHPKVEVVSDLMFDAVLSWPELYPPQIRAAKQAQAEVARRYPKERRNLPQHEKTPFERYVDECLDNPLCHRQGFDHFTTRIGIFVMRWPVALKEVMKHRKDVGPPNHPDIHNIERILEIVRAVEKQETLLDGSAHQLWFLNWTLDYGDFGPEAVEDLDLLNPARRLIYEGEMMEWSEEDNLSAVHLLLLDNYLRKEYMTRSNSTRQASPRYRIVCAPIPLSQDSPVILRDDNIYPLGSRYYYPLSLLCKNEDIWTVWTDTIQVRDGWYDKIESAKTSVFTMTRVSLNSSFGKYTGTVTCSTPLIPAHNQSSTTTLAMGGSGGVLITISGDPHCVIDVPNVTKLAVLNGFGAEEQGLLLVLSDKNLLSFLISELLAQSLVPSQPKPIKISSRKGDVWNRNIISFAVGSSTTYDSPHVVYIKDKETFWLLRMGRVKKLPDSALQQGWFGRHPLERCVETQFFPYTSPCDVQFMLANTVSILNSRRAILWYSGRQQDRKHFAKNEDGFTPLYRVIPNIVPPDEVPLRPSHMSKPLAVLRATAREYLVCYEAYGLYVAGHHRRWQPEPELEPDPFARKARPTARETITPMGEPSRGAKSVIMWKSQARSVAHHPPYFVLTATNVIEIRDLETGELVQTVAGKNMRCICTGDPPGRMDPMKDPLDSYPIHILKQDGEGNEEQLFALTLNEDNEHDTESTFCDDPFLT